MLLFIKYYREYPHLLRWWDILSPCTNRLYIFQSRRLSKQSTLTRWIIPLSFPCKAYVQSVAQLGLFHITFSLIQYLRSRQDTGSVVISPDTLLDFQTPHDPPGFFLSMLRFLFQIELMKRWRFLIHPFPVVLRYDLSIQTVGSFCLGLDPCTVVVSVLPDLITRI